MYTWTSQPPGFTSNDAGPVVSPLDATTYFVTAVGTQQCVRVGEVSIDVVQGSVDAGLDQTICAGTRTNLSAATSGAPGVVVWSPGNVISQTIEVAPLVSTDFVASYTPGNGCTFSDTVRVNVFPAVQLSPLNAQPDSTDLLCEGTALRLSVAVVPADVALYWTQNGEVIPSAVDTVLLVKPVGGDPDPLAYVYNVVATDANGCTATATPYNVQYQRCLRIPNVFSPGNDDINETFGLVFLPGGSVELLSIDLYNRWGQKVFEGSGGQDRWDGTVDGKPAPADVYLYVIKVRFVDGKEEVLHGDVTLLR
jgi:gliding motility-associated-like protein